MLSGRGLCDELITRPEESYRLWCVVVCDLETSRIGLRERAINANGGQKLQLLSVRHKMENSGLFQNPIRFL